MQHGRTILAAVVVVAITSPLFSSAPAQAQDPRRIFGALGSPFRMMLRGFPRGHYRHRAHRTARAHYRRPGSGPEIAEREPSGRSAAISAGAAGAATAAFWPSTSPSTYEDMVGYALWPREYERQFWSRGPRDIMQAMIAPAAAYAAAGGDDGHARRRPVRVTGTVPASGSGQAACIERAREHALRPLERIPAAIELNEQQRQKFGELRTAVREAIERETAACRGELPATQPERLRAMIDALWAMRYAEFHIRTSLNAFYDSLTDEQKTQLAEEPQTVGGSGHGSSTAGPAAVCSEAVAGPNPFGSIERSLRLNPEQRKSLQMLGGASMEMAQFLRSSCPAETPDTPMARLDAAGDRVMSLLHAAMNIEPMLNAFYGQLSNEQRARFNMAAR
jgi:hypothetical protein